MSSEDCRYTVGIDLGTTNTVVSYRLNEEDSGLKLLEIEQVTTAGVKEKSQSLPSFLYQPLESELESSSRSDFFQDWEDDGSWMAGIFARD
ncbi:MAG: Hsp70 family protein, partial [Planctomycetes bacterium]|nr:Hsp70 family protein [Planctomycetota bacterium]